MLVASVRGITQATRRERGRVRQATEVARGRRRQRQAPKVVQASVAVEPTKHEPTKALSGAECAARPRTRRIVPRGNNTPHRRHPWVEKPRRRRLKLKAVANAAEYEKADAVDGCGRGVDPWACAQGWGGVLVAVNREGVGLRNVAPLKSVVPRAAKDYRCARM